MTNTIIDMPSGWFWIVCHDNVVRGPFRHATDSGKPKMSRGTCVLLNTSGVLRYYPGRYPASEKQSAALFELGARLDAKAIKVADQALSVRLEAKGFEAQEAREEWSKRNPGAN